MFLACCEARGCLQWGVSIWCADPTHSVDIPEWTNSQVRLKLSKDVRRTSAGLDIDLWLLLLLWRYHDSQGQSTDTPEQWRWLDTAFACVATALTGFQEDLVRWRPSRYGLRLPSTAVLRSSLTGPLASNLQAQDSKQRDFSIQKFFSLVILKIRGVSDQDTMTRIRKIGYVRITSPTS